MKCWWQTRARCGRSRAANRRMIATMRGSWRGSRPTMCGCCRRFNIAARNDSEICLLQARDTLVRARTMLVNAMRGLVKCRATTAQVFDGIVCQGSADDDSRGHGAGAHTVVRAGGELDGADPADGQTDRGTGETVSGSGQVTERTRSGTCGCNGVRVDTGLARGSGKEPGGGRVPGITAAAKPSGGVRSAATDQQNGKLLSAPIAGTSGAICIRTLWTGFRTSAVGPETGC